MGTRGDTLRQGPAINSPNAGSKDRLRSCKISSVTPVIRESIVITVVDFSPFPCGTIQAGATWPAATVVLRVLTCTHLRVCNNPYPASSIDQDIKRYDMRE